MYVVDKATPTLGPALIVKKFRTPAGLLLITDITDNVNASRRAQG